LAKAAAALASSYYISGFVMPEHWIGQLAAAAAIVLLYPALLGVLGFYNVAEIETMRAVLNHKLVLPRPRAAPAPPGTAAPEAAAEPVGPASDRA
jgi:hypothetical protein